jgi:hypothetical protein
MTAILMIMSRKIVSPVDLCSINAVPINIAGTSSRKNPHSNIIITITAMIQCSHLEIKAYSVTSRLHILFSMKMLILKPEKRSCHRRERSRCLEDTLDDQVFKFDTPNLFCNKELC